MTDEIGRRRWVIADGWIPPGSTGPEPEMTSHDAACMLNASNTEASVEMTVFFSDRDPYGPYKIKIPARRVHHQRLNDLAHPAVIPVATDYCVLIDSDIPIVVQHTRLDTRQAANALMSTIAYPA